MDPLIQLLLGIIAAFGAGALGSAAVILINDKKMAAVEKVKRRILHGPERPPFVIDPVSLNKNVFDDLFAQALSGIKPGQVIRIKDESTAKEIEMKRGAVSPPPKPPKDIMDMDLEEFVKWRRANR